MLSLLGLIGDLQRSLCTVQLLLKNGSVADLGWIWSFRNKRHRGSGSCRGRNLTNNLLPKESPVNFRIPRGICQSMEGYKYAFAESGENIICPEKLSLGNSSS